MNEEKGLDRPEMCRKPINVEALKKIAIYLSGVKDGKGNLDPLGTVTLDDLWDIISYLQGDVRFKSDRES